MNNKLLVTAGISSFIASVLHVAVIIGGPGWYRFFGAGEQMATLAEQGSIAPTLMTLVIAIVLFAWGLYAFSGAGIIRRLPFLKFCLVAITIVYLVRGLIGIAVSFIPSSFPVQELGFGFMFSSSLVCTLFGMAYLVGVFNGWSSFSPKNT